ncbi:MAG: L-histidine N(alpha)-methyltransferase, partial [Candidatus Poribacteria bacterium]|nr:L-histidine N(alpha)-methyltransferase [Candidatus Poribacteria bacterium]
PEYYLTRTEQKIFEDNSTDIIDALGHELAIVEFGSGNSIKTRLLINAALKRQKHLHYIPVDISSSFLKASSHALLGQIDELSITAIAAEYADALPIIPAPKEPRLFLFIGSNIGNFNRAEAVSFMTKIRKRMDSKDRLLISFDLVKASHILEAAYNDAAGVTAAFNKNLLARINRELGATFSISEFDHFAPFVQEHSRIEMRLISKCPQYVYINNLQREFSFEQGEYIHTEDSHKYTFQSFAEICRAAGLEIQNQWLDKQKWFAVALLKPREI